MYKYSILVLPVCELDCALWPFAAAYITCSPRYVPEELNVFHSLGSG